jgi:hypothetical protein
VRGVPACNFRRVDYLGNMKRISAILAAVLVSGLVASAGGVRVGVGIGFGGIGVGFHTHGFSAFYAGFPGYCYPGYYGYPYYGRAYYAPYYAAYPAYSSYAPTVTYAPAATAPAATPAAATQVPVIINNYNYYNTSPQAGVNAMFGR